MNDLKKTFVQFVKFSLIGVSNVIVSYIFYLIVIKLDMHYTIANVAGYVASICNAFYWNNRWVFKSGEGEVRKIAKAFVKMLISYAGTGLVLNTILLSVWIEGVGIPDAIAPAINIVITTPINFLLNKCWVFAKTAKKKKG